jgi:hypothetical protein
MLKDVFIGGAPLSQKALLARKSLARLVDKTVRHYNDARKALIAQVDERQRSSEEVAKTGVILYLTAFVDCMEDCLVTCRRIVRFIEVLKSETLLDRTDRRLLEANSSDILPVRNLIEHMAQAIAEGTIEQGEPIAPYWTEDGKGVAVKQESIGFETLASFIKAAHRIAQRLADIGPVCREFT